MMKTCIDKAQPQIRKQNPCQQVNWKAVSQFFFAVLRYCMDWKQALKGKINAVFRH